MNFESMNEIEKTPDQEQTFEANPVDNSLKMTNLIQKLPSIPIVSEFKPQLCITILNVNE